MSAVLEGRREGGLDKNVLRGILGVVEGLDVGSILRGERQLGGGWLLGQLTGGLLVKMQIRFKNYAEDGVDVADFARVVLELVDVPRPQRFHLAMASIQLYQNVCEAYALSDVVRFKDLTNYIIDVASDYRRTKSTNTGPPTPSKPRYCRSKTISASAAAPGTSTSTPRFSTETPT
jgi:hypothetical protein